MYSVLRPTSVEPLFCLNQNIPRGPAQPKPYEICQAMAKSIHKSNVDGAQNIWGVWRLYTKTKDARLQLLTKGFSVRGVSVPIYESNPRTTSLNDPDERTEKITVRDMPLSVDNKLIEDYLVTCPGLQLCSNVRYSKERNENGDLTDYRNGDRYIYAKHPINPILPEKAKIGDFTCRIFHPTQRDTCKICSKQGHKSFTEDCPAYDQHLNIKPFRSEQMVESNFFPCDLYYKGVDYHSSEQAFQHVRAINLHCFDIAENIMHTDNPRSAQKEGNKIPENIRKQWDTEHGQQEMLEIVREKASQVEEFKTSLLETNANYAEGTLDRFWGCGLLPEQVQSTKPEYWPGENVMGQIVQNVADELKMKNRQTPYRDRVVQMISPAPPSPNRIDDEDDSLPETEDEKILQTKDTKDANRVTDADVDKDELIIDSQSNVEIQGSLCVESSDSEYQDADDESETADEVPLDDKSEDGGMFDDETNILLQQLPLRNLSVSDDTEKTDESESEEELNRTITENVSEEPKKSPSREQGRLNRYKFIKKKDQTKKDESTPKKRQATSPPQSQNPEKNIPC